MQDDNTKFLYLTQTTEALKKKADQLRQEKDKLTSQVLFSKELVRQLSNELAVLKGLKTNSPPNNLENAQNSNNDPNCL